MMTGRRAGGTARDRTGWSSRRLATTGLIVMLVIAAGSQPSWGADRARAAAASWGADDLAHLTGPRIETTVVAMELRGLGKLDVIGVPDLDIVERKDGVRLLPLLRLLRGLALEPRDSASVLTFIPDGGPIVTVDYAAGTATLDGETASIPMQAGISDVTNLPELYVAESAVGAMLAMDVVWDPRLYAYTIKVNRKLRIFDRRRENAWLARRSAFASYDLPGNLPPAHAERSILPSLQFTELQLLSSLSAQRQDTGVRGTLGTPRVGLWAEVLGGNLVTRLSGRNPDRVTDYRVEQLSWGTSLDRAAFSAGSVNLGLSELVFPSLSLIGAVANGRMGSDLGSEDPSQLGRQQAFLPLRVFDGYARIGSEVTLSINGQDVETRRVEPAPDSPPGDGPYRFEGVNLFSSRLNDVRIRIVAPDGSVEETRRRVLGTDLLLDAGEVAFIGGFGGRRNPSLDDFAANGRFGGGRLNLGVTRRLSTGMSAAYQDQLYGGDSFLHLGSGAPLRAPSRSLHMGSRLAWQPIDPLLLSTETARSQSLPDSGTNWAVRADAEYQVGELNLHPAVFRYGPAFFDGQNPDQRDLSGVSMGLLWRYGGANQLAFGGSRTHDNLDGSRAQALRSSEVQGSWSVRGIVPRMVLTLGGRQVWIADSGALQTGLLGLEGPLPWGWSLRGHQEFGDDIRLRLGERLDGASTWRFDLSNRMSSAPGGGAGIGVGSQTSSLELRRRLDDAWHVNVAHRAIGTIRRSSIDLTRTAPLGGIWQARISPGYEWDSGSQFLQDRFELFLSRSRSNRLIFEHQILRNDWLVRLSFQIQTEVGFAGVRPVPLFDSRLDPSSGGVRGRVFLDSNGNGLADPGEPGLAGVEVVTDQGRRAVSTSSGLFVLSNSSSLRRTRVSLQPDALPATYTLTQATQEAILRPGEFTEVNLGVAVLGSISGSVVAEPSPGERQESGVSGVRVLLVDSREKEAGVSITGGGGVFTINDIRPGRYALRLDMASLPSDFVLESPEIPIEVTSQAEPFEQKGLRFVGRYTDPRIMAERVEDRDGVVYKVFSRTKGQAATRPLASTPPGPASSLPEPVAMDTPAAAPEPNPSEPSAPSTVPTAAPERAQAEPPASTTAAPELAPAEPPVTTIAPTPPPVEPPVATTVPPTAPELLARSDDPSAPPPPATPLLSQREEPVSTGFSPDGWQPIPGSKPSTTPQSPVFSWPWDSVSTEPSVRAARPSRDAVLEPAPSRGSSSAPEHSPVEAPAPTPEFTTPSVSLVTPKAEDAPVSAKGQSMEVAREASPPSVDPVVAPAPASPLPSRPEPAATRMPEHSTARAPAQDPEPSPAETIAPPTPIATRPVPEPSPTSADAREPAKEDVASSAHEATPRFETSPVIPAPMPLPPSPPRGQARPLLPSSALQHHRPTLTNPVRPQTPEAAPEVTEKETAVVPSAQSSMLPRTENSITPVVPTTRAIPPSDPDPIPAAENTPEPVGQEPTEAAPPEPEVVDSDTRFRLVYGRRLPGPSRQAPEGPCECEVEGTVEVRSDRPLSRPVVVSISLADAPAYRDSVELFMGSPREFRLGRVPCGSHELAVMASSPKRFTVVSSLPAGFECVADRLRQFRIVLEAR